MGSNDPCVADGIIPSHDRTVQVNALSSPALPVVPVALRVGGPSSSAHPGAVAAFAASQGVEAEGMVLTHVTLGPGCAGRAEAPPRRLLTKAPATAAGWPGRKEIQVRFDAA